MGIGASAGGLEALNLFFRAVPRDPGMAFVVVEHREAHGSLEGGDPLVDILQQATALRVVPATDGLALRPDHVYIAPSGTDLSLLHGRVRLLPPVASRLHLPIDSFFRSLAEDLKERSMGVVLSGMGSDGTLGLRALREMAGAAFAQSPESAKFDSMPRSAIASGVVDVVASAAELPARLLSFRRYASRPAWGEVPADDETQSALEKIFVLLRAQTGNDFSLYKRSTLHRRIERRMVLHQVDHLNQYVRYLRENANEVELLFKELLIGVTSFFRDPASWEALKVEALPQLLSLYPNGGSLRAWVPGCSTGEEVYSLAMAFREAAEPLKALKNIRLQIFATDLDADAIARARQAFYPSGIEADVSPERLRRFFRPEENGYRVTKDIREMVVFAPQNVIMDPPFTKLDILCCRNLLIYLSGELQRKLIPLFHYSLSPGGILFLGSAETIGGYGHLFSALDGKTRLFRKLDQTSGTAGVEFPSSGPSSIRNPSGGSAGEPVAPLLRAPPPNLQAMADRLLVQRLAPLGVLCSDRGDVLYISGRAAEYLEPAVGKANLNLFAMAKEGLRRELTSAFRTALREERTVTLRGVALGTGSKRRSVDLSVEKLTEPRGLRGSVMVVLSETVDPVPVRKGKGRAAASRLEQSGFQELEHELERAMEEVQTTREEMQTSQEELKSTNEELQSTNEELQSTNEELTTSKEEMQSLNEELQTVNRELQAKVTELSRSNNDMKNLLNSTDIATLFLDGELNVRRFTTPMAKIIKLIPVDAGRPITDIASDLEYPDLAEDAREVLRTLIFREKQVANRDGRWFSVRIMPYRTLENVIDGLVITFTHAVTLRPIVD